MASILPLLRHQTSCRHALKPIAAQPGRDLKLSSLCRNMKFMSRPRPTSLSLNHVTTSNRCCDLGPKGVRSRTQRPCRDPLCCHPCRDTKWMSRPGAKKNMSHAQYLGRGCVLALSRSTVHACCVHHTLPVATSPVVSQPVTKNGQ